MEVFWAPEAGTQQGNCQPPERFSRTRYLFCSLIGFAVTRCMFSHDPWAARGPMSAIVLVMLVGLPVVVTWDLLTGRQSRG